MIGVKVVGLDSLVALLEKFPQVAEKNVNLAINRTLVRILGAEKREAPVHTGFLRDAWSITVGRLKGTLRSNASYAMGVHEGTRPHAVSGETLAPWAKKKGLNPWAVANSIKVRGTAPNPFLRRAVDSVEGDISREFETALNTTLKELT